MKVNQISFALSSETFGPDTYPTDVVEIYIDGENLGDMIPCGCPMWPEELYTSLMRACFLKEDPVNIFVCGCGCVGCSDTEVYIEETEHFVIWHDFCYEGKFVAPGLIFVFDREQYYAEVDKILCWAKNQRLAYYIGNVFTVWSDELRFRLLADHMSDGCVLQCDFNGTAYRGKEAVLQVLRRHLLKEGYSCKVAENYFYRVLSCSGRGNDNDEIKKHGYDPWYLQLYRHEDPDGLVMAVAFKVDAEGKISEILLRKC